MTNTPAHPAASASQPPIIPVLLCGGSGTRLWPLSRAQYPKQFLRLLGEHSLLQATLLRLAGFPGLGRPVLITNETHRFLVAEQIREISIEADILLEPTARNTAPALAAAAQWSRRDGQSPLMLVLPSDHVVTDIPAFQQAVTLGLPHAAAGRFVTFGITPERPETGYGYIRRGAAIADGFAIDRFVEKPDLATAQSYLDTGEYYWNSGMFLFRADRYLQTLHRLAPDIADPARNAVDRAQRDLDFIRLDSAAFSACRADSIDYALMEKIDNGIVIPLAAGWNDIGAWDTLCRSASADFNGNTCVGDVIAHDCNNNLIRAESRLVTTIGLTDMVVIETADAVLIAPKNRTQDVKKIVEQLLQEGRTESDLHTHVHRPWGSYQGIVQGERYQVKRIIVKPGKQLSLQKHHHRAEHWIVVKGTAKVTRGTDILLLSENESTYIPLGIVHRLENLGKIDLEMIEVQSGGYLGEDDIVRLEDSYGRTA
ncbi:MAG: mannose-1-phosphate guanylyltransferase/mannose-6-phosphate isomerase [Rhodocyclales bacterium]|nr:mannose-1-phosphate guanylyltransferase/mannose-6-phosphate isomerase [Rhodocyclales bacterium]